ncbi:MAG: GH32 C-terminal domain-containing protein, partial [Bacilli bacterium]|nr:GH32 C-terminal domain-containing protein [Bacilli bacterium]
DIKEEDVYHSSSKDGMSFEKGEKVFDNSTLPSHLSQNDFRDPCPVKIGDSYYLFIGGKDLNENKGVIIVLKSKTLDRFEYAFHLGPYYELGDMAECPCYRRVDDKDVILVSGCNVCRKDNDFRNINCSLFIVGELDFEKGKMKVDFIKEIDKGDSFYAPQFINGIDRPIMVGWLEMWGKKYPTSKWHHGYVGAFSIPRELSIKDGDIYQKPVEELDKYVHEAGRDYLPRQADINVILRQGGLIKIEGDNGDVIIENTRQGLYLDTRQSNNMYPVVRKSNNAYENCKLRILLDTSSIELFIDDGREAISSRIYIDGELRLSTAGEIEDLKIKEIGE